jgi:glycerol-3-phosphate cytidylyltransferase-like family protein
LYFIHGTKEKEGSKNLVIVVCKDAKEEHKQKSIANATRRVELNSVVKMLNKITIL